MKYSKIISYARTCIANSEKYKKANVGEYSEYTLAYIFSKSILNPRKDIEVKSVPSSPAQILGNVDGGIGIKNFEKLCQLYINWVDKHNQAPSYLIFNGDVKIGIKTWTYACARVVNYYWEKKRYPNKVLLTYKTFYVAPKPKPEPAPEPEPKDEVYEYFVEKFGSVDCIDDCFEKIQGRGYGYYYDDRYSNKTSIDRMADGDGVNCTDSCHVFWHLGKALDYDVRAIHVMCRGGDGHIRLQFNRGNGWFDRDPAAVLDGNDVSYIWCRNGEYLSTDPDWFLENLNR